MLFTIVFFTLPPVLTILTLDMVSHVFVAYVFRKLDSSALAYEDNNLTTR